MKVVVTGASGKTGQIVVRKLLENSIGQKSVVRSEASKAKLASLGIARSEPPAMPREAWSGSPYSSPGRAAAASSKALGTGPSWLS